MKIVICDDDLRNTHQIHQYITRFCEEEQYSDVQIIEYYNPTELLNNYPKETDLLIMDIEMPGINGIQAAREIRLFDENVTLIYMTNYAKYALEGYSVQAYNYLLKPVSYETISRELKKIFSVIQEKNNQSISLNCEDGYRIFLLRNIDMCETMGKNVILHARGEKVLVYKSMKQMEEILKKTTFRIHSAYLVSMHAIRRVKHDSVVISDGTELPLSKHRKKEFISTYMKYVGGLL